MSQGRSIALLLPDEPLSQRLGVFAVCLVFGAWMIHVGRLNVRASYAEETGKRAIFLKLMGSSVAMQGRKAVLTGWMRIVVGSVAIVFGAVFLCFGAFLK